ALQQLGVRQVANRAGAGQPLNVAHHEADRRVSHDRLLREKACYGYCARGGRRSLRIASPVARSGETGAISRPGAELLAIRQRASPQAGGRAAGAGIGAAGGAPESGRTAGEGEPWRSSARARPGALQEQLALAGVARQRRGALELLAGLVEAAE